MLCLAWQRCQAWSASSVKFSVELELGLVLWLGVIKDRGSVICWYNKTQCSIRIEAQSMTKTSQPIWPSSLQVPRTPRPGMESADSRRLATKHSRKALKASLTLGILLGMFFVTWLPFFVANIAQVKK